MLDGNENILDKILKFEDMINSNKSIFLDLNDLEDIILYYLNEENFKYAEKAIDFGINLYPENLNIIILKSELLLLINKKNEAENLVSKFIKFNNSNLDLIFQKAKILTSKKKYKDSIKLLTNIAFSSELDFYVNDLLFKNYINIEDYINAIKVGKKIIFISHDNKLFFDKLLSCYKLSKKKNEAIKFLNEFLDKNPYSAYAWNELGKVYFEQKKFKESKTCHDFAIISDESFTQSYLELAKIHEKIEDFSKAIYYYKIVDNKNKSSTYSLYRLSRCYEKIYDYDTSMRYLNRIVEEDPLYEKAWISIAKYYLRKDDHDKAIENLNTALNIISKNY